MLDIVYEFFTLTGLDAAPQNLGELIVYLLHFFVAVAFVMVVFKLIAGIARLFFDWRWFK